MKYLSFRITTFIKLLPTLLFFLGVCTSCTQSQSASAAPAPKEVSQKTTGRTSPKNRKTDIEANHLNKLKKQHSQTPGSVTATAPKPPINQPQKEQFVTIGKAKMRVLTQGNPKGQPLLMLHGATFRAEIWEATNTLQYLAKQGFWVVAADLPGHGKSGRPNLSQKRFLKHLILALDLHKPVILAHSMGGAYALPLIAKHPELLAGGILISPVHSKHYAKALKGNPLPILVLWGGNDRLIPVRFAHRLASFFPNSQKVIFNGAGHECYNESTDEFHLQVSNFIKNLAPKTPTQNNSEEPTTKY